MYKTIIIIALAILFQTTLYADDQHAQGNARPANTDPEIITPAVGSRYNLNGMQTRDGQHKSSYSTKSVDDQGLSSNPSSNTYGANGAINPVVPVIIVTDE